MIHILIEDAYRDNHRANAIFAGVQTVAKGKKTPVCVYEKEEEIPKNVRVVILICASLKWTTEMMTNLRSRGIHALLFGFQDIGMMYEYSCVTPTYMQSSYFLTRYMISKNKGKVCFLGYNRDSMPDRLKLSGVKYAVEEMQAPLCIYENTGATLSCIENFVKDGEDIRTIVCANDAIAILLETHFPEFLEGMKLP